MFKAFNVNKLSKSSKNEEFLFRGRKRKGFPARQIASTPIKFI